jgi:signal transduction histidine kinase
LYLSRKIVEAHGGIIWLDNTDGKGSTLHSTYY